MLIHVDQPMLIGSVFRLPGSRAEVADDVGRRLCAAGFATLAQATPEVISERADIAPRETATAEPRGRARRASEPIRPEVETLPCR